VWTIRNLVGALRSAVEQEYADLWVEGEISNFRPAESGHLYFTLKDGDAQLRVVMFRSQARLLRFQPADGTAVVLRGKVTVYEQRGELQLIAEHLEPKGAGALLIAFEQLKARLAAEGLFDEARKRPIPSLPRRIGVVTSPRGAAIQDILNVLRRRHESVSVLIYPAQVQGEAAGSEVSAGVNYFNRERNVDVIIVARGGGSVEDLAAFNHEGLARTIAASQIPVISAVGHETDVTITDFVADLRAPTPSAAAEMVIQSKHEVAQAVLLMEQRLARAARYRILMARQRLTELAQHASFARLREALGRRQQRVDDLVYRLTSAKGAQFDRQRRKLDVAATRLQHFDLRGRFAGMRRELQAAMAALASAARTRLLGHRGRLDRIHAQLEELSPVKILDRGYALVFDAAGKLVKDAERVKVGDEISARLARGTVRATVKGSDV
jgi:exodeoxyribonuclease VII large subunit